MLCWIVVTILLAATLGGCAMSEIQTVRLDLPPARNTVLYVLPLAPPGERFRGPDLSRGLFWTYSARTFGFEDQDLDNLQQSLVRGIGASRAFQAVHAISATDSARPSHGVFLTVRLQSAGVVSGGFYWAVINGRASIEDDGGRVLGEKVLDANEAGLLTLSQSKNNAIEKIVQQVAALITTVVIARDATSGVRLRTSAP
jgi:hypothetical protein